MPEKNVLSEEERLQREQRVYDALLNLSQGKPYPSEVEPTAAFREIVASHCALASQLKAERERRERVFRSLLQEDCDCGNDEVTGERIQICVRCMILENDFPEELHFAKYGGNDD